MSVSLPSREIYNVDVPEPVDCGASFVYNFFTVDERVSETGGTPSVFLKKNASEVDSSFLQYATTRAPRYVIIDFSSPKINDSSTLPDHRERTASASPDDHTLVSDNQDKIVSEDNFASNCYTSISFHDGEIDDKVYEFVSGSYEAHTLDEQTDDDVSHARAGSRLASIVPSSIKRDFLVKSIANPKNSHGTTFIDKNGSAIKSRYYDDLKDVSFNVQVNSKALHGLIDRSVKDPHSRHAADMSGLHKFAKKLKSQSIQRLTTQVSEVDFKTVVPYIEARATGVNSHRDQRVVQIVGYIVDKLEVLESGQTIAHPPIILDGKNVTRAVDFKVKYGSRYCYNVRTIAQFTLPAIDDDTQDIATIKVLVSSKPSNKSYVTTEETVAPPPPSDLNFTWDYERPNPTTAIHDQLTGLPVAGTSRPGSLMVHWTFPPNSQRDIKKFQVFRRSSIDHPFELIKMYDFDDSVVKQPNSEDPDPTCIEYLTSPCTFLFDDEFIVDPTLSESPKFTYAVASIDAHGMTSAYSAQFEVWFDRFKNALQKRLVSHSGAPKPYPNLYLEADAFIDTIKVSGQHTKKLKLYFNPEFYSVYDDDGRVTKVVGTAQEGTKYKFQFINTDVQSNVVLDVSIDDRIPAAPSSPQKERVFGKQRKKRSPG